MCLEEIWSNKREREPNEPNQFVTPKRLTGCLNYATYVTRSSFQMHDNSDRKSGLPILYAANFHLQNITLQTIVNVSRILVSKIAFLQTYFTVRQKVTNTHPHPCHRIFTSCATPSPHNCDVLGENCPRHTTWSHHVFTYSTCTHLHMHGSSNGPSFFGGGGMRKLYCPL